MQTLDRSRKSRWALWALAVAVALLAARVAAADNLCARCGSFTTAAAAL
jgi:hypothetical protein